MNRKIAGAALAAVFWLLAAPAGAVVVGQSDAFDDGTTQGWFAGGGPMGQVPPVPPMMVPTGGPAGAGDAFLQVTALGGDGPGSRLSVINASQWAGNYTAAGVPSITMQLCNLGTTDLSIRLLFEDPIPGPPQNEALTDAVLLPAGGDWTPVVFAVRPQDLTAIQGTASAALANTTIVRIVHAFGLDPRLPVVGTLGVDDIVATPMPGAFLLAVTGFLGLAGLRRLRR